MGFSGFGRVCAAAGMALLVNLGSFAAKAEPIGYFQLEGVTYNDAIPTPDEVLGHGLGDRPIRHDKMVAYLRQLAGASDRMTVETIGHGVCVIEGAKPDDLSRSLIKDHTVIACAEMRPTLPRRPRGGISGLLLTWPIPVRVVACVDGGHPLPRYADWVVCDTIRRYDRHRI